MSALVKYRLARVGEDLHAQAPVGMYEYCLAANGVFVRAQRKGLYACIPVAEIMGQPRVRGLGELEPVVRLDVGRVQVNLVNELLERARKWAPLENLTWLKPHEYWLWMGKEPNQVRTSSSVRPVCPFDLEWQDTLIDLHSHHIMRAFFSAQDDKDEMGGFRIFAVLGRVLKAPEIAVRVGIYGHFYEIDSRLVFDLPEGLADVNAKLFEMIEEDEIDAYLHSS